jgi:PA domain
MVCRLMLLLFLFLVLCVCSTSFNMTIEIRSAQEKIGLNLNPDLEIVSFAKDKAHSGLLPGDRLVGINGIPFTNSERNIKFFTSTLSEISLPYTLNFEYAKGSVRTLNTHVTDDNFVSDLTIRASSFTLSFNSTISGENKQNLTVFSCEPRRIVVAHPPTACGPIRGQNGDIKGAYVLVLRGVCLFEVKLESAILGGAEGVIVVNSDDGTFSIPLAEPSGSKGLSRTKQIPLVMISKKDGNLLMSYLIPGIENADPSLMGYTGRGPARSSALATLAPKQSCLPRSAHQADSTALERKNAKLMSSSRGSRRNSHAPSSTTEAKAAPKDVASDQVSTTLTPGL